MSCRPVVVKVGGSLFNLDDLGARLSSYLETLFANPVIVPGGGPMVEELRAIDRRVGLGAEPAHWLALRMLSVNAHLLTALLPPNRGVVVGALKDFPDLWQEKRVPILDCYRFCLEDCVKPNALSASWETTSDSIAARLAVELNSPRLILLKSIDYPEGASLEEAACQGMLDGHFASARRRPDGTHLDIEWVNFRSWQLPKTHARSERVAAPAPDR